jgi:hypothetical protein
MRGGNAQVHEAERKVTVLQDAGERVAPHSSFSPQSRTTAGEGNDRTNAGLRIPGREAP